MTTQRPALVLPTLIWDVRAALGEGPLWVPEEQALWFVDIKGAMVHRHVQSTGEHASFSVGGQPSFIVLAADGGYIIGSEHRIFRFKDGKLGDAVATIDQPQHNRTNDATVDSSGRLWFGTMDDEECAATGGYFCLDRGVLHAVGGAAVVTNGPAVSADGTTIYQVDSANRTIWQSTLTAGPTLINQRVFVQFEDYEGHPDGIVLDAENCLWVALWDGWAVRRYAPDGTLLQTVAMPCARVTKIAFGGPDLRTAYVTSARTGLSADELAAQPLAGGLFAFDVPVAGVAMRAANLR
jgi:sugar lactone lactonase YvrE